MGLGELVGGGVPPTKTTMVTADWQHHSFALAYNAETFYMVGGNMDGSETSQVCKFQLNTEKQAIAGTKTVKVAAGELRVEIMPNNMATVRVNPGAAVCAGRLYVVGGQDENGVALDSIEFLLLSNRKATWKAVAAKLAAPRASPVICKVGPTAVLIAGG